MYFEEVILLKNNLPVMLLKKIVLLPHQDIRLDLNNDISNQVVDLAIKKHNSEILIVCAKDPFDESPDIRDLPTIGIVGKIKSSLRLPNNKLRIIVNGYKRVKINQYINEVADGDILKARISELQLPKFEEVEETTLRRKLYSLLEQYMEYLPDNHESLINDVKSISDLDRITDIIVSFIPLSIDKKITI